LKLKSVSRYFAHAGGFWAEKCAGALCSSFT
jgi:hypothetical protein